MDDAQGTTVKRRLLRVLKWCAALVVIGAIGLAVLLHALLSVGYLNMAFTYWQLKPQSTLAMAYPLEPGQSVVVRMEGDSLVAQEIGGMGMGGIEVARSEGGGRYAIFDRGGGHLGIQGYVFAPHAEDADVVHRDAFGGFEGRAVKALFGGWYTYESTEE